MSFQDAYKDVIDEHRRWLGQQESGYLDQWNTRMRHDQESATCEAMFRRQLEQNGCTVRSNEDLTGSRRAPDFHCMNDGREFYVEVTCLSTEIVTKKTGLPDLPQGNGARHYASLNRAVFDACRKKTEQLIDLPAPRVVAVGTFHFTASVTCIDESFMSMLLTGTLGMAWSFDPKAGEAVGEPYEVTHLQNAAFVKPGNGAPAVALARLPVSALIVGGFGPTKPRIFGLLHPQPKISFDRRLLPNVRFCQLKPGYDAGQIATEWV